MRVPITAVPLDRVLTNAVLMHWEDFRTTNGTLLHIEYHRLPLSQGLEYVKVWSTTIQGVWDLVCQYWMHGDRRDHERGITFHPPFHSTKFGQMFAAIMQNQGCFSDLAEQTQYYGMIQVSEPTAGQRLEARLAVKKAFTECSINSAEALQN